MNKGRLSPHMTNAIAHTVALAAQTLPDGQTAPEWVQLLPAGPFIHTVKGDKRGPFMLTDAAAVIAASFAEADRLPIDENHAIDHAGKSGGASPARGWITEMHVRADGIWGKVEWTAKGRELIEGREYRAISPVIRHSEKIGGRVTTILRAALVNNPGLVGLTALFQENPHMPLIERLAELLGLDASSGEDAVFDAVKAMKDGDSTETMSAQLAAIGKALGVDGGDHVAILAAAQSAGAEDGEAITALRAELATTVTKLNALTEQGARSAAEAAIDDAIKLGVVGVKPLRDHYINRFMKDPEAVQTELAGLPALNGGSVTAQVAPEDKGKVTLSAAQKQVAAALGQGEEDYAATLAAERSANGEAS